MHLKSMGVEQSFKKNTSTQLIIIDLHLKHYLSSNLISGSLKQKQKNPWDPLIKIWEKKKLTPNGSSATESDKSQWIKTKNVTV